MSNKSVPQGAQEIDSGMLIGQKDGHGLVRGSIAVSTRSGNDFSCGNTIVLVGIAIYAAALEALVGSGL